MTVTRDICPAEWFNTNNVIDCEEYVYENTDTVVYDVSKTEAITRMAGTCEDVTVRMKKNVLNWFGHVERMSE